MRRLLFGVALLASAAPATAQSATRAARPIALRFGTLVDGAGRTVRGAVVVVSGDRIVSVGAGARAILAAPRCATSAATPPFPG